MKTNLLRISIFTEEFLFRSRNFHKTPNFSEQLHFQQMYFLKRYFFSISATFENSCFFRKAIERNIYFLKRATFSELATFSQYNISEEVLFRSFTSFPQLHFLFISQLLKELYRSSFLWINYCSKLQHMHSLFYSVVTQGIDEQLLF